jgi:hypothetical protein
MRKPLPLLLSLSIAGCYGANTVPGAQQPPQQMMTPAIPMPMIVDFTASKLSAQVGDKIDLIYTVMNADSVTISTDQGKVILPSTTELAYDFAYGAPLQETTTFILSAVLKDQTTTKQVTVTVGAPTVDVTHAEIGNFSATPANVMPGEKASLTWQTTNAATGVVTQDSALVLTIASTDLAMGMYNVTPTQTTVYTIKVKGSDGQEVSITTAVNVSNGMGALTARQMFDQNVAPILQMKCSTCHADTTVPGPDFLGTDKTNTAAYYTSITADPRFITTPPENSLLLLKGEHTGPAFCSPEEAGGTGSGRGCTPTTEKSMVEAWLVQEGRERTGTMMPPTTGSQPRTLEEAMTRFGACMDGAIWDQTYGATQETEVAYQQTTQGPCYACHSTGTAGSFLSQTSHDPNNPATSTFDQNRLMPDILKLVQPTYNTDGTLKDLVPADRWILKGQEATQGGTHPTYNLSGTRQQALSSFLTQTLTKYRNYAVPCMSPGG